METVNNNFNAKELIDSIDDETIVTNDRSDKKRYSKDFLLSKRYSNAIDLESLKLIPDMIFVENKDSRR